MAFQEDELNVLNGASEENKKGAQEKRASLASGNRERLQMYLELNLFFFFF